MGRHWRQGLHLEPPTGWLNDPNGLCFYQGKYHVYFQYCPESAEGKALKCWGHYQSPDLIHWEFTGTVLKPDIPEDKDGVYSGSAIEKDGMLHLFYTGNVKEEGEHDYILSGRGANVIHVVTQDGHTMSAKEVVLRNRDYPEFCSCHVRDPKIWKEADAYYMVLGARTKDDKGCVLVYTSSDLKEWEFLRSHSTDDFGYMWECPDYFRVSGEMYLGLSPQGLQVEEYRRQNVYHAGYFQGDCFTEWDYGFDFYAPQTFDAPDGRTILIGWMGLPDIDYHNPTAACGWQHCLTLPRVLERHSDGSLTQFPVSELTTLQAEALPLSECQTTPQKMPFTIQAKAEGDFYVRLEEDLFLTYTDGIFAMKFTSPDLGGGRTLRQAKVAACREINIFVDNSSLEVYLDHGKYVFSTRFYPKESEIRIESRHLEGSVYRMNAMPINYLAEK